MPIKAAGNRRDSAFTFTSLNGPFSPSFVIAHSSFQYTLEKPFDFGLTRSEWCYVVVKFDFIRNNQPQLLIIDNTSLDSVLIFRIRDEELDTLLYRGGNAIIYEKERPTVWHTAMLDPRERDLLYLVALKAPSQNIHVRLIVRPPQELEQTHILYQRLIFVYLGCIGIIFLSALVSFALLRQRMLMYYAAYILFTAGWIFAHYGYAYALIYPHFPDLNPAIKPMTSLLALWFLFDLIFALVPQTKLRPVLRKTLKTLQAGALLVVLVAWFRVVVIYPPGLMLAVNVLWHILLLTSILLLLFLLFRVSSANLTAKLLILAVSAPLVMSIFQIFSNAGFLNAPSLNEHGLLAAQLFEALLLAFVIIYRIFTDQKEKASALQLLQGQQRQTLQSLISLQDNERKRIAQDLHDSIGPLLAAIKINVHRLEDTNRTKEEVAEIFTRTDAILDDSIAEIRNISHQLMPKGLSSKGLIHLLSDYFKDLEWLYKAHVQFKHKIEVSLPQEIQLNVYRMVCELVLNAAKHGQAKKISVEIETGSLSCKLTVKDNGKGFHVNDPPASMFGLVSMQRRVAYLKGEFDIDSQVAAGTCITVTIPLFIPG